MQFIGHFDLRDLVFFGWVDGGRGEYRKSVRRLALSHLVSDPANGSQTFYAFDFMATFTAFPIERSGKNEKFFFRRISEVSERTVHYSW